MTNSIYIRLLLIFSAFGCLVKGWASEKSDSLDFKELAVKTNLLYDVGGVPSLGLEFPVSSDGRWRLDLSGSYNPFRVNEDKFWKTWMIQPEIRFFPRFEIGARHKISFFLAAHLLGGQYNLQNVPLLKNIWSGLDGNRYEGWALGAGIGVGFRYDLIRNLGVEVEIGGGVIHSGFNRYVCGKCGERVAHGSKNLITPTKLSLNLVYCFSKTRKNKSGLSQNYLSDTIYINRIQRDTIFIKDTLSRSETFSNITLRSDSVPFNILFRLDDSRIDSSVADNMKVLREMEVFFRNHREDPSMKVTEVRIDGYSSLEGPPEYNQSLSTKRAEMVASFLSNEFPEISSLIRLKGCGEDWISVEFPFKDKVMEIQSLGERQKILMNLEEGKVFRQLLDSQLPSSRKVDVTVFFNVIDNS